MSGPRVLISHGASGREVAKELASRLVDVDVASEAHSHPGKTLAARVRARIDGCEILVVLHAQDEPRSDWLQQEIGYALARGARVLLVARGRQPRGLLGDDDLARWPRTPKDVDKLAALVRARLPATPRASVRSLTHSSQERWTSEIRDECTRELRARGWEPLAIPSVWEGEHPVFATRVPELVWRKRSRGRWIYLRARVTPFNPVDLVSVRARAAPRVFEWWLLRNGRSDGWMRKLYRGASEPITAKTRFFGQREPIVVASPRASTLISSRFLTQRIERTGEIAAELERIEAWMMRAAAPARARPLLTTS